MTYEDVKRIRQNLTTKDVDNKELSRMIDAAIEKQIPKKSEHDDGIWNICTRCGGSIENDIEEAHCGEISYCYHCGQAIDWSGIK